VRRGFGASGRLTVAAGYRVADLASDLVAVMEAAGFERFSVFGYSFTGAFAPWLAALAFYRELSDATGLPGQQPAMPAVRVLGRGRRGDRQGGCARLLAAGLDSRGLEQASFPGHDHEGMLAHINEAVPSVLAWFDGLPPAE
jgi:hypothetical protein